MARKSTCGLCKPDKKWKQTDTKAKQKIRKEIEFEVATAKITQPSEFCSILLV